MRMWRHIHWRAFAEAEWPEPIEKAPGPDQASSAQRQRALDSNLSDADLANRVRLEPFVNGTKRLAGFSGDLGHKMYETTFRAPAYGR